MPFNLLYHREVLGRVKDESSDVESELNIWRFEAFVMKELSPMKKRLVHFIFMHLDIISAQDSSRESVKQLYEVVGRFLFHPPAHACGLVGDFCSRVLQARLFVDKRMRCRSNSRSLAEHRVSSAFAAKDGPSAASSNESKAPTEAPFVSFPGADCVQQAASRPFFPSGEMDQMHVDSAVTIDDYTTGLHLAIPPGTLSEFLVSAKDMIHDSSTWLTTCIALLCTFAVCSQSVSWKAIACC